MCILVVLLQVVFFCNSYMSIYITENIAGINFQLIRTIIIYSFSKIIRVLFFLMTSLKFLIRTYLLNSIRKEWQRFVSMIHSPGGRGLRIS